jgi:hypothetical protein
MGSRPPKPLTAGAPTESVDRAKVVGLRLLPRDWTGKGGATMAQRTPLLTKKRIAVFSALALIGLVAAVAAVAAVSRSAPISKFDGINEIVEACTTTKTFSTMPQMTRTFTLGGTVNDEVVAMFQGSLSLDSSGGAFDTGFIRLTIDGVQQSPGVVPAIGVDDRGTHGFNWQTSPLKPGSHTARVQWRTDLGSTFCADARSLIVLHK